MSGRLALTVAILGAWMLAIVVRLYGVQINDHDRYADRAARQQQREVVLDAPRGTIYDVRGRELAVSIEVQSVAADASKIEDPEATAQQLSALLDLDRSTPRDIDQTPGVEAAFCLGFTQGGSASRRCRRGG